jgi:hypothetical protein
MFTDGERTKVIGYGGRRTSIPPVVLLARNISPCQLSRAHVRSCKGNALWKVSITLTIASTPPIAVMPSTFHRDVSSS